MKTQLNYLTKNYVIIAINQNIYFKNVSFWRNKNFI